MRRKRRLLSLEEEVGEVPCLTMRKFFTIAGAIAGLLYTCLGMATAYRHAPMTVAPGRIVMEFLVLAIFTAPLGAAVGLGIGLLVDGLRKRR